MGKPNINLPTAPFQPIIVFEEPFSKIIVDCVGSLSKTKKKAKTNMYLRYFVRHLDFQKLYHLERFQLKKIEGTLIILFTKFGLPKEMYIEQGFNFISNPISSKTPRNYFHKSDCLPPTITGVIG